MRPVAIVAIAVAAVLCLIYRESILTLYLGQFSIIEFGLLAAIWGWLMSSATRSPKSKVQSPKSGQGREDFGLWTLDFGLIVGDALAGVGLAVLATKPQAVGLGVLLILVWALSRRRWAIPAAACGATAVLLLAPNLFYPWSLDDWLSIVFGRQATSQVQVSASVWGVSYQWLGGTPVWTWVALALTLAGLLLLVPSWKRDLRDIYAPAPLSLLLAVCVNSVISPYMLGYEHVLLLFPALVLLASVGLPSSGGSAQVARGNRLWRLSLYAWMAVLPLLIVVVQAVLEREYPAIAQSLSMLALCWVAKLGWKWNITRNS
jgi:hypothetical protein